MTTAWEIKGDYFENCSCDVVCPCLFSAGPPMTAMPTQGTCDVALVFHVDRGAFGEVALDDLTVVLVAHTPGRMGEGNWTAVLYVDQRASAAQQAALEAIFSGAAGGLMANFAPLITTLLPTQRVAITYRIDGKRRSVEVPGVMSVAVRPITTLLGADLDVTVASAHPLNPQGLGLAVGEPGSRFADQGLVWDNSGKNGHYAPFRMANA